MIFPPWVILHIPHDSVYIPASVRKRILLTDAELNCELLKMTDFWTYALFGNGVPLSQIAMAPVNRLVVDVERFSDDKKEVMASRGMGVIYTITSEKTLLREKPTQEEKDRLVSTWYAPHHARLTSLVDRALAFYGKALVLDCHSFASKALPYEENPAGVRPEICLGKDAFHTPKELLSEVRLRLERAGFDVDIDSPFSGALTPMKHYRKDARVKALMLEVRRDLYEDEDSGAIRGDFGVLSKTLVRALSLA